MIGHWENNLLENSKILRDVQLKADLREKY